MNELLKIENDIKSNNFKEAKATCFSAGGFIANFPGFYNSMSKKDDDFCCLYGNDAILVSYLSRYTPKAGLICGNMVIQIGLRINRSMNYVISKLKEARVSYYIINRTTGYKEEDKFISEDKEAFKRYLPEAKKYVLIKSKAEAVKFKIDKLLDYPDDAIEKLNKIERILEEWNKSN